MRRDSGCAKMLETDADHGAASNRSLLNALGCRQPVQRKAGPASVARPKPPREDLLLHQRQFEVEAGWL
jgi:hypothetical protein